VRESFALSFDSTELRKWLKFCRTNNAK